MAATATRNITEELKTLQTKVKALVVKREGLIRDAGVEERKVQEAIEKLAELGIDAAKLSVEELENLRVRQQSELEATLSTLNAKVTEADALVAAYEKVA
jgi:DNA repair exonuclease SbcCD ATPase subunit